MAICTYSITIGTTLTALRSASSANHQTGSASFHHGDMIYIGHKVFRSSQSLPFVRRSIRTQILSKMEEEKMQRLYDTLAKLAPKHASGLGMLKGVGHIAHRRDETLPQNPLYSRFVRAGSGIGQYHKR
eukprot:gene21709-26834_t